MSVSLNPAAVIYARHLIQAGKIKNDEGHWREHNPDAADENAFLAAHEMSEYANWHLGLDMSRGEDTKGRYKFPYGNFRLVHREGVKQSTKIPISTQPSTRRPGLSGVSSGAGGW